MIVTAAQAIMRHTLTMKKKWRNLSRKEHSGNLQWEIYNKKKKDRFMKHNFNALFYKQFQNEKKYRQKVKCSNVYIWLRKKIWNLFCLLCRRNINGSSIWYINVRLAEIFLRGKEEIRGRNVLTTNFLWRKYWYWHNSQQGGPLRRREDTSSHFCKR